MVAIEHLPEKVAVDLKQIADWLNTSRHTGDYLQAYPKIRSTILVKSLERCVRLLISTHITVYILKFVGKLLHHMLVNIL